MSLTIERSSRVVAALSLVWALGCTSTSPTPSPEPEPAKEPVADTSAARETPVQQARVSLEPVYFDTDESVLKPAARTALEEYARAILDNPQWGVVTIDGHCDERGTDAYNRALGRERAAAVERFLVGKGVPRDRIATRSFGADRPAVPGHDEEAWRYNRRSEFRVEILAQAF